MTEPVYEFVKGQGWVIAPPVETLEFFHGTNSWLLLARKPRVGELYMYCGVKNHTYSLDGYPILKNWASMFFQWNDPAVQGIKCESERFSDQSVYITVIPL